jgi:hypothetical protein
MLNFAHCFVMPLAIAGFWRDPSAGSVSMYRCLRAAFCAGGNQTCAVRGFSFGEPFRCCDAEW